jgi:hypothetical protein
MSQEEEVTYRTAREELVEKVEWFEKELENKKIEYDKSQQDLLSIRQTLARYDCPWMPGDYVKTANRRFTMFIILGVAAPDPHKYIKQGVEHKFSVVCRGIRKNNVVSEIIMTLPDFEVTEYIPREANTNPPLDPKGNPISSIFYQ